LVVSSFLLKTFSSRHILHSTFRPNGSHLILFFKPFLSIGLNFHPKMLFPKFLKNCLQSAFQKSDQSPEIFSLSVKFSLYTEVTLPQLALRPVRTRSERGSWPCRMLVPSLRATGLIPLHFVAQGGICWHCRSGLTPDGDLSFPCSDTPLRDSPRQDQHFRSTASAFHRILKRPVRPLNSSAHPTLT
jgi:hypothetical protein